MHPLLACAIPGIHAAIEGHLLQGQREDKFGIVYQDCPDWVGMSAADPHTRRVQDVPIAANANPSKDEPLSDKHNLRPW
jgi:hypothetical protein